MPKHQYSGKSLDGDTVTGVTTVADTTTLAYDYDLNNNLNKRWVSDDDSLVYTRFDGSNCDSVIEFSEDSSWVFGRNDRGQLTNLELYYAGDSLWTDKITYEFDHRGLMTSAVHEPSVLLLGNGPDTILNLYNASGQKVKQTHIHRQFDNEVGRRGSWVRIASNRYYVWSGGKVVLEYDNTDSLANINIYGLGQRLMRKNLNNTGADSTCFYVNDYHGSVRSFVDSRGLPGDRMIEYYPYGAVYSQGGLGETPHWFIGKEKDETEELDFGPRYYSRSTGRFLAPDPILAGPSAYSYAEGNPVMASDPTGLAAQWGIENVIDYLMRMGAEAARAEMAQIELRAQALRYFENRDMETGTDYNPHSGIGEGITLGWGVEGGEVEMNTYQWGLGTIIDLSENERSRESMRGIYKRQWWYIYVQFYDGKRKLVNSGWDDYYLVDHIWVEGNRGVDPGMERGNSEWYFRGTGLMTNGDGGSLQAAAEAIHTVETVVYPYIEGYIIFNTSIVVTGAGAVATVGLFASTPTTGPAGPFLGLVAGVPTMLFGSYITVMGADIMITHTNNLFGTDIWAPSHSWPMYWKGMPDLSH